MSCFFIPLSGAMDIEMDAAALAAPNVPQSWQDAAASWGMDIEDYKREAERVLNERTRSDLHPKRTVSDLVPLFNPYANLNPIAEAELRRLLPAPGAYEEYIRAHMQISPKFTIPR